jgi:hypothetical protein
MFSSSNAVIPTGAQHRGLAYDPQPHSTAFFAMEWGSHRTVCRAPTTCASPRRCEKFGISTKLRRSTPGEHLNIVITTTGHSAIKVLFWAGAIAGSIDLAAASVFGAIRGIPPRRLLQGICSALIGPKSFELRRLSVALGFALHFVIAFTVAAIYVTASRYLPVLIAHPIASGMLYGICVHITMTFGVLPLTFLKRPFSMTFFLGQLLIHAFCVGLPIALVVRHFSQFS